MTARVSGFTIIEVVLAITVLGVGMLALASTTALVARMVGNGHRAAVATAFAAQRLERLRTAACSGTTLQAGSEDLVRSGVVLVLNRWRVSPAGATWHLDVTTTYRTAGNRRRTFRLEAAVVC